MADANWVTPDVARGYMERFDEWELRFYAALHAGQVTACGTEVFKDDATGQHVFDKTIPEDFIAGNFWHRGRVDWDTGANHWQTKGGPSQLYYYLFFDMAQIEAAFAGVPLVA